VPAVAGVDLIAPGVGERTHPGRLGVLDVKSEWQESLALRVGLSPDGHAVFELDGAGVVEAAYAAECAERVVE